MEWKETKTDYGLFFRCEDEDVKQKIEFKRYVGFSACITIVGYRIEMQVFKYINEVWDNDTGKSRWDDIFKKRFSTLHGAKKYAEAVGRGHINKFAY